MVKAEIACVEIDYGIRLSIKTCSPLSGVDNTSLPFYGQSILTSNFASRSTSPFFLSSSLQLTACSLCVRLSRVCLRADFYATKFAYDVGLVSTYSAHYYSTFSPTSNLGPCATLAR